MHDAAMQRRPGSEESMGVYLQNAHRLDRRIRSICVARGNVVRISSGRRGFLERDQIGGISTLVSKLYLQVPKIVWVVEVARSCRYMIRPGLSSSVESKCCQALDIAGEGEPRLYVAKYLQCRT